MVQSLSARFLLFFLFVLNLAGIAQAQTVSEKAGAFLTTPEVTGILLTLGILFWFLSVLTMGTGIAEVCCFVCFGLLFGGRYLEGQELWIPIALFVAGAVFGAVEVFVIPGLGVFGVLSMVSFAGLSVLLMESPQAGLGIFCLSILLSIISGFFVMKYLPKFFVTRKLFVLDPPSSDGEPKTTRVVVPVVHPGDIGEAATTLRPVGAALFGTERVEVISEGEFLQRGARVEVVSVEGQKVVVRSVRD